MADLDQVKGINSRQIKLLEENGVSTAEALAMSPHSVVSDIDGLGEKTAKKLIWNARNALGMSEFIAAEDIDENTEYITTGSAELNRILGGGVASGKLTEVFGPFKSGKTNLAHTIAVTTQMPLNKGGLGCTVAYIDTENTFSKEKIKRIAKRFGVGFTIHRSINTCAKQHVVDEKGPLKVVCLRRNELAHGETSFRDCGQNVTVRDLRNWTAVVVRYLREVMRCFDEYLRARGFERRKPAGCSSQ